MKKRSISEIGTAITDLEDKVWYDRHRTTKEKIERGEIPIVKTQTHGNNAPPQMQRDVWKRAQAAATKVRKRIGARNLGPWNNFDGGMLNGKLSALRWVMGEDWDMLDT